MRSSSRLIAVVICGAVLAAEPRAVRYQPAANGRQIIASSSSLGRGFSDTAALVELRAWTQLVDDWSRSGEITRIAVEPDSLVNGRTHERFQQTHLGVPIWSGDLRRQLNAFGQAESIFGAYYPDVDVDVVPAISGARASVMLAEAGDGAPGPISPTDLVIVPTDRGFRLAWTGRVISLEDAVMRRIFLDAKAGDVLFSYDDTWRRQDAPATFDMRGDAARATRVLAGLLSARAAESDAASEPPVGLTPADAQAALRTSQEFFLARFGRRGLAARAQPVRLLINADRQLQAAYYGGGDVVLGTRAAAFAGADLVALIAHELAHGITEYSSNLIYLNEAGALNEAFSEVMALSAKRYAQDAGLPAAAEVQTSTSVIAQVVDAAVSRLGPDQSARAESRARIDRVVFRAFTSLLPSNATLDMAKWATRQAAVDLYGAGSDVERALGEAWAAIGR